MKKRYMIFGNPVGHSKSPAMHNAAFKKAQFDGEYETYCLEDGEQIRSIFLAHNLSGANITVPHKEVAFRHADEVCGIAKDIGAVNTYVVSNNQVLGYNTDAPGFLRAIESFGLIRKVLVIGGGGSAKAIAFALIQQSKEVSVVNRSIEKLPFFKSIGCNVFGWCELDVYAYDLVVNTTSAGLHDEEYPMPPKLLEGILKRSHFAFDCIYNKETPFLKMAKQYCQMTKDGEDMLLFQGVFAWQYFTNQEANDDIIQAMREALQA